MENYREMREQKLKSVDEILHQISCMDRAVNEKQLDAVIPFILKAIGKYANADRVYIFDWVTGKRERITNTFRIFPVILYQDGQRSFWQKKILLFMIWKILQKKCRQNMKY